MAEQSQFLIDVLLEDKIADIWPEYPCLYDVRSPDFKNRDLREKAYLEIAEKLEKSGKTEFFNNQRLRKTIFFRIISQIQQSSIVIHSEKAWWLGVWFVKPQIVLSSEEIRESFGEISALKSGMYVAI